VATVEVFGQRLFYRCGRVERPVDGRGVVFLHGAGGNGQVWQAQRRLLGDACFCCAPDLPGHGRSEGQPSDSVDAYADTVMAFMDAVGITRATLVGHSMGGAIAQVCALSCPDCVESLVLIGSGAKLSVAPMVFSVLREAPATFPEIAKGFAFGPGASDRLRETILRLMDPKVALTDFIACDRFDVRDRLSAIRARTCVVVGSEDGMTPVKWSRYLAASIAGAVVHEIEGAGHMVMVERPDEVGKILRDFLRP
jgi:pimeloyl-ACP methyl ester carboxylesterase